MDTWCRLLGEMIENVETKKKVTEALGLKSARTLDRWAQGLAKPQQMHQVLKLAQLAARSHPQLELALQNAFPVAFKEQPFFAPDDVKADLSLEFLYRMLEAHSNVLPSLRRFTIKEFVFQQMVRHLDPNTRGLACVFCQAVQEEEAPLYFVMHPDGAGNQFWDTRQLRSSGSFRFPQESCLGAQILSGFPHFLQDIIDTPEYIECFLRGEEFQSGAVYSVKREGAIAGGVILCSVERDFFTSIRKEITKRYIDILGLAFYDKDFLAKP